MVATCAAPEEIAVARCTEPLRRDQRQQRGRGGALEGAGDADHEGGDEYLRHGEPAGKGADGQKQRRRRFRDLAKLHHALALEPVGGVAGDENQQRRGQELHQPDHAELEGAAGDVVDLPADRNRRDLAGEARQAARQQEEQERPVPEQIAGADRHRRGHGQTRWPSADAVVNGQRPQHGIARPPGAGIIAPGVGGGFMLQLQSAFGVLALLAIAWALGENRRAVSLRQMAVGLAVTVVTALVLLKLPPVAKAFGAINDAVNTISAASRAGTSFVFGYLGGGALPFDLKAPGADFILAFQALPIILVMSVLTTLLFYWRVLPPIVRGMAWLLERTLGVGGAVGLSTAANIFLGMVEAPLFIRPYLAQLTRSELFLVMTGGMAGIAGTVLVLYATFLAPLIPDAAAHFVIASVLGAPAAILVSLIMVPETSDKRTGGVAGRSRHADVQHHGCDRQGHHGRA